MEEPRLIHALFPHQEMQAPVEVEYSSRRLAWQEGQNPLVLQEDVNRCSLWQAGQRIRAKPERGLRQSR
jgi:hypothetical protein